MLLIGKHKIEEVKDTTLDDMVYVLVKNEDIWKIKFVQAFMNIRKGF